MQQVALGREWFAFGVFLADLQHNKRLMSVALTVSGRGLSLIKAYLMQKASSIWSFSVLPTFILLWRSCKDWIIN